MANGNVIANFTNSFGQLQIQFINTGTIPVRSLVNEVLQAVQYQNTSSTPPSSVNLSYSFDDGSGAGSSSLVSATTTINIATVNNAPVNVVPLTTQNIVENTLHQTTGTLHFNGNISEI